MPAIPAVTRDLPVLVDRLARGPGSRRALLAAQARACASVDRRSAAEPRSASTSSDGVDVRCSAPTIPPLSTASTLVVPSPGVPPRSRAPAGGGRARHPGRERDRDRGAPSRHARSLAVTGTNGKSTTTTLLGAMLAARRPARLRRRQPRHAARRRASVGAVDEAAVVEVSSFQLEWVDRFRPRDRRLPEPHRRPPRPLRRPRRLWPAPSPHASRARTADDIGAC